MLRIIGLALLATPFLVLTGVMWQQAGIKCVVFVWGFVFLLFAFVFSGMWFILQ